MVTISCPLRNSVSGRSTTTDVSTGRPSWSMPLTRRVSRGSSGSGRTLNSFMPAMMGAPAPLCNLLPLAAEFRQFVADARGSLDPAATARRHRLHGGRHTAPGRGQPRLRGRTTQHRARAQRRREEPTAAALPRPHRADRRPDPVGRGRPRRRSRAAPASHGVPAPGAAAPLDRRQCRLRAEPARRGARDAPLERVGLAALARRPARVLSGGERQRLALARAWALEPQVLFLDEPTASLDPAATRAVEDIIDGFHRAGTKIIMTTHDLGQARRLADEVVFLHQGRVLERAAATDFFASPASEAARAFLAGELPW